MTVRPLAYLLMTAVPLAGASVDDRLNVLERDVSELQSLVHALDQRSKQPEVTPNPPAPSRMIATHLVRTGDSYWSISRRHGLSVTALERANPGINPRRLFIGSRIQIPGQVALGKNISTPASRFASESGSYTVRSGDVLGRISENHGIRLHQLLAANPGVNPRRLKIGTVLSIPGAPGSAPAEAPSPKKTVKKESKPVEAPRPIEAYQPAPPPESPGPLAPATPEPSAVSALNTPKTILVTVDKDMRLAEVANQHATSVTVLNELNEVSLSPEQMIKTGSQLYVPGR
jgi:LysM repeat protein